MTRRMRITCLILLIVFGGLIGYNLIKKMASQYFFAHYQRPAVTVSSAIAEKKDWQPKLSLIGSFVAVHGVDVNTESPGKVVMVHFESGDFAAENAPLVDLEYSVEQAALKFNLADLSLRKINYQRELDLIKKNATAQSSVDDAKARLFQAEANVEKTQAEINLKHIKAPFAGQLGIRQINLGQYVEAGRTNIVSLQSLDPIYLDINIPEQYVDSIHLGQAVEFSVEQNPGIVFHGSLSALNSKIDDRTHTLQIQVKIANCPLTNPERLKQKNLFKSIQRRADQQLDVVCDSALNVSNQITQFNFIPGMFASVEVGLPLIRDSIMIPSTAISYSLYGDSVFLIQQVKDDKGKEQLKVKRVFISTSGSSGLYTAVNKGIKAGDRLVSAGELKLQDGTSVEIDNSLTLPTHPNINELGE